MSSARYSKLPMADEDSFVFDFSSAFTFEERNNIAQKYKSAFTYGSSEAVKLQSPLVSSPSKTDKVAKLLVTVGYVIIYVFTFPIMLWFSFKKISENERLVVFRLGRLHKLKGPGFVFLFPLLDRCHKIDVRLKAFSVPPKQIITEDGAIIEVGAEIYFQIVDAEKSVTNVQNLDQSTRVLVQTSLCNILAKMALADIESERRIIADNLLVTSNKTCKSWGVEITRAELSQIKVLSNPPEKKAPTFVKPPGLFKSDSSSMPAAFAHLAAALGSSQGQGKTEAITQALHLLISDCAPGVNTHQITAPDSTDLVALLSSSDESNKKHTICPSSTTTGESLPSSSLLLQLPVLDPENVISLIRLSLCESIVDKIQETYQFEISGAGSGTYFLDLKHGKGAIGKGPDPYGDPAATLSLTFDDLQAMLQGHLNPFQAYMSGRLKVSGDTAAVLKLEELGTRIRSMNP